MLIDMATGLNVTTKRMAQTTLECIASELTHWSGCSSCLRSTTAKASDHRAARLAKPLMSP